MRIAIVSGIHGNRASFEAVLAGLRQTSPDLILHGGDLAHGGASPAWIVDRSRDLGWQGELEALWTAIGEMAAGTRQALGEERIAWLGAWPRVQAHGPMALVPRASYLLLDGSQPSIRRWSTT